MRVPDLFAVAMSVLPSPLHATFLEVLSQLLSPSLEQRQLAEQQLQALQVTEGEISVIIAYPDNM